MMQKLRSLGALGALAAVTSACNDRLVAPRSPLGDLAAAGAPALRVERDPDIWCPFGCDAIAAGDSMRYVTAFATPNGRDRYGERAQWSTSDARIATVSATGMVRGLAPGEVEVRATVGTRTASARVTIGAARVERIVVAAPDTSLAPRQSVQLAATGYDVFGKPVDGAPMSWFAATPAVVQVDAGGRATAVAPGDAMVVVFGEFGRSQWIALHVEGTTTAPALAVATVDVGGTQACAAGADGAASCWGSNYFGQLGNGTLAGPGETFPRPLPVAGGVRLAQLALGDFHSCALDAAGAAWCWGDNSWGRLGNGDPAGVSPVPTRVVARTPWRRIGAGGDHTCAIDEAAAAWCWGFGGSGQLGTGSTAFQPLPERVLGDATFDGIYPALWHSCALGTDGAAWCWGANDFGQLGNGKVSLGAVTTTPSRVSGKLRLTAMDSRVSHACGLTATGEAWCWGRNDFGQAAVAGGESVTRPARVAGPAFTAVATGAHHSCALAADGRAWCWGNNDWGQLGDNTLASRATPAPVSGTLRFTSLAAGNNVTCGTTMAGEAWCWGSSHFGMLGNGQDGWDTISAVPVRVVAR